jgi:hypothetical protein
MAEMEEQNPNIRQQLVDWRMARVNNSEDPFDYQAFRKHLMDIGAPDIGEQELDDFRYE